MEARPHNIHVHTLCPGGVDTDLIKGTFLGERLKGEPMIKPDDIAGMVVFLLASTGRILNWPKWWSAVWIRKQK